MIWVTCSRAATTWKCLFTLLAERYERKSVIHHEHLLFTEWNRILKDPMTTAPAIDRLVHHAVTLDLTGTSVRADEAESTRKKETKTTTATTTTKDRSGTR